VGKGLWAQTPQMNILSLKTLICWKIGPNSMQNPQNPKTPFKTLYGYISDLPSTYYTL